MTVTNTSLRTGGVHTEMRYTTKSDVNLRGWMPDDSCQRVSAKTLTDWAKFGCDCALLLKETAKAHKRLETKEMISC